MSATNSLDTQEIPVVKSNTASSNRYKRFNRKRKPFSPDVVPSPEKRATVRHGGQPEFSKEPKPALTLCVPRYTQYRVYVSNLGLPRLCRIVRETIVTRDTQLRNILTTPLLTYVTNICFINRLIQVSLEYHSAMPEDASKLNKLVGGIKLPLPLCNFIESIGCVTLANGARVVPHISNSLRELMDIESYLDTIPLATARIRRNEGFAFYLSHVDIEDLASQHCEALPQIEGDDLPFYDPLAGHIVKTAITAWRVNPHVIHVYNENMRTDKVGLQFRAVNNSLLEGKAEMLSCFQTRPDGAVRPTVCEQAIESTAQLGAVYQFRSNDPQTWLPCPGNFLLSGDICLGREIADVDVFYTSHVKDILQC